MTAAADAYDIGEGAYAVAEEEDDVQSHNPATALGIAVPTPNIPGTAVKVMSIVRKMLGGAEVDPDTPLMEAGLDSLGERPLQLVSLRLVGIACCAHCQMPSIAGAVELGGALGAAFELELPTTGAMLMLPGA